MKGQFIWVFSTFQYVYHWWPCTHPNNNQALPIFLTVGVMDPNVVTVPLSKFVNVAYFFWIQCFITYTHNRILVVSCLGFLSDMRAPQVSQSTRLVIKSLSLYGSSRCMTDDGAVKYPPLCLSEHHSTAERQSSSMSQLTLSLFLQKWTGPEHSSLNGNFSKNVSLTTKIFKQQFLTIRRESVMLGT